jgi:hypothetical protein
MGLFAPRGPGTAFIFMQRQPYIAAAGVTLEVVPFDPEPAFDAISRPRMSFATYTALWAIVIAMLKYDPTVKQIDSDAEWFAIVVVLLGCYLVGKAYLVEVPARSTNP